MGLFLFSKTGYNTHVIVKQLSNGPILVLEKVNIWPDGDIVLIFTILGTSTIGICVMLFMLDSRHGVQAGIISSNAYSSS